MTNGNMDRGEYWLLEAVVESWLPLDVLESPELEMCLNKTGHGLTHTELVDTLDRLFQDGYLQGQHAGADRRRAGA